VLQCVVDDIPMQAEKQVNTETVAVCCSVLLMQCVAVSYCCRVLQCVTVGSSIVKELIQKCVFPHLQKSL